MSIVLNEYEWAERAIKDKSLGKKPYETLSRVAKYYTYKNYSAVDSALKSYIEKDPALERRFQPVMVEEPTLEDINKNA